MKVILRESTPAIAKQLGANLYFTMAVLSAFTFSHGKECYFAYTLIFGFAIMAVYFVYRFKTIIKTSANREDFRQFCFAGLLPICFGTILIMLCGDKGFHINHSIVLFIPTFFLLIGMPALSVLLALIILRRAPELSNDQPAT